MDNQNLILLAIGVFLSLIVTISAVDQFLLDEHPPLEVDGLIWRVENAFSRIQDLETVLEVTEEGAPAQSMRLLVRYLAGPPTAMSVRYLAPSSIEGELFTIENDVLSQYFPQANLVVVKRWVGVPVAAVGLAGFDLTGLREDWVTGEVRIQVMQSIAGFTSNLITSPLVFQEAFGWVDTSAEAFGDAIAASLSPRLSFSQTSDAAAVLRISGFASLAAISASSSLQGSYILEVRDASSGELERMIWVERDTYLIRKVVSYQQGVRQKTIRIEWILLDQGLTEDDLLNLPRDAVLIRG